MGTLGRLMMRAPETCRKPWLLALMVGTVLLGACRDPAKAAGTALYVTTQFDPALLITQVRVWGTVESGADFGPQVLPEQPQRLLDSGETLRVLLGDAPNGVQAQVSVEGLSDGQVVARGEASAQVRDGYEVDVTLRLEPIPTPPTDGGDPSFCMACDGCCQQGRCTNTSVTTCGRNGAACVACDTKVANTCDARGQCACGSNPACSGTSDQCFFGLCRCGSTAACAEGQMCVGGTCRCNPDTCAGCCSGNTCEPGTAKDKCGKGGGACLKCTKCNPNGTCG